MKYFDWDEFKNVRLKAGREVCFEDVLTAIDEGGLLDDIPHPNKKYKAQRLLVIKINNYAFVIPYVEDDKKIFLKTIYPSRKFTNKYLSKEEK